MSFAKTYSAQISYLKAVLVTIEVDISRGLHAFSIVGMPDKSVEEARDRISAAIKNSGFDSPKSKNQKVIMSLAPAELKKEGAAFDVGMAITYLKASGEIDFDSENKMFFGELSLDGSVRKINGSITLIMEAKKLGITEVYLPKENAVEAALISDVNIYPIETLRELIEHINTKIHKKETGDKITYSKIKQQPPTRIIRKETVYAVDISDIKGQEGSKRALEIAAAGGHNIALYGPPGTGKTMLAKAFCSILPQLTFEEILEATAIHSVSGTLQDEYVCQPPFRAPHHSASYTSVIGGSSSPKPGEVTLAHRGVLFLDEFPEFDRRVLESLREPLEEGVVRISRSKGGAEFPARFILIAAMNPCPCGNYGNRNKPCICVTGSLQRYRQRISGPIIDRVDLWVEVSEVNYKNLSNNTQGETSATVRKRVETTRALQYARAKKFNLFPILNCEIPSRILTRYAELSDDARDTLTISAEKLNISARAYHRIIKIARTIADMDKNGTVEKQHILEALQYRPRQHLIG
jgi:magnesium chelatase family protein